MVGKRWVRTLMALVVLTAWASSSHLCSLKMAMAGEAASCHVVDKSASTAADCCQTKNAPSPNTNAAKNCCMDDAESVTTRLLNTPGIKVGDIPAQKIIDLAGFDAVRVVSFPQTRDFVPQIFFTQSVLTHTYSFHSPPQIAR